MENMDSRLVDAAQRLRDAEMARVACAPVRDLIGASDVDAAYAVQTINRDLRIASGRRVVGRKVGLTAKVVQAQLGVDQPDFGVLFDDMVVNDDEPIELASLIAPRAEAEIAFVLGRDVHESVVTTVDILRATEFVVPAIEVVDSRVDAWDITITDTIADNASSARFVLGTSPKRLSEIDVRAVAMTMALGDQTVSSGDGSACLGNPVAAVVWLANALSGRGDHLRAGDVILSGALGPMVSVSEPGRFEASLEGLGSVFFVLALLCC
jgi:2-keto-4-pentenoate hydratase